MDDLIAGVRDLLGVLGLLDLRDKFLLLVIPDRGQLVYAAEGRAVFGSDHVGAYSPGGDGGALILQAGDQVLVQVAGSRDHCI